MATTNGISSAVQSIVSEASGVAEVYPYIPTTLNSEEILFLYAEPPTDTEKATNLTHREYNVLVWCLVMYSGNDDTASETRFNDLTDAISLALISHKTLNGTVRSSDLKEVNHNPLVEIQKVIYRVRIWHVAAWEDILTVFS